jgi:hypothetical protein
MRQHGMYAYNSGTNNSCLQDNQSSQPQDRRGADVLVKNLRSHTHLYRKHIQSYIQRCIYDVRTRHITGAFKRWCAMRDSTAMGQQTQYLQANCTCTNSHPYAPHTRQTIAGLKQMVRDSKAEMENARISSNADLDDKIVKKSQEVGPKGIPGVSGLRSHVQIAVTRVRASLCEND